MINSHATKVPSFSLFSRLSGDLAIVGATLAALCSPLIAHGQQVSSPGNHSTYPSAATPSVIPAAFDSPAGILADAVSHCPSDITVTFHLDDSKGGTFQRDYLGANSPLKCRQRGANGRIFQKVMMAVPIELLSVGDNNDRHRSAEDEEIVVQSWAKMINCPKESVSYKDNQWMTASLGHELYYRSYPSTLSCTTNGKFKLDGIDYPSIKIKHTYYLDGGFQLDNERVLTYIEYSRGVYLLVKNEKTENSTDPNVTDPIHPVYTVSSILHRNRGSLERLADNRQ